MVLLHAEEQPADKTLNVVQGNLHGTAICDAVENAYLRVARSKRNFF